MDYYCRPGFTGTDRFTFKVNDGKVGSSNTGTMSVTVNPPPPPTNNHPPTAIDQSVTTNQNTPVNITLGGTDPDQSDMLTAAIVMRPSHGTLSNINEDTGDVNYTPNSGFTGTDRFTMHL